MCKIFVSEKTWKVGSIYSQTLNCNVSNQFTDVLLCGRTGQIYNFSTGKYKMHLLLIACYYFLIINRVFSYH